MSRLLARGAATKLANRGALDLLLVDRPIFHLTASRPCRGCREAEKH